MKQSILIFQILFVAIALNAQEELLDPSYGVNGRAIVDFLEKDETRSTAIDAYDRLIIGGTNLVSAFSDLFVCRLTSTGELDLSFGADSTTPGFLYYQPETSILQNLPPVIRILNSGKIVIGMAFYIEGLGMQTHIIRLTENGSLDTSFGNNGVVILANNDHEITNIYERPDGSLIVLNDSFEGNSVTRSKLVRISENGQFIDDEFASSVIAEVSEPYHSVFVFLKLFFDGEFMYVLTKASFENQLYPFNSGLDLVLWKFDLATNELATDFGENGVFTYRTSDSSAPASQVAYGVVDAVLNSEMCFLITLANSISGEPNKIMKLNPSGTLCEDYADAGFLTFDFDNSSCNDFRYFSKHPTNGFYIMGYNSSFFQDCADNSVSICQINEDGYPISMSYPADEFIHIQEFWYFWFPSVQVQSDGNILLTSFYFISQENNDTDIKTVRILADMVSSVEESEETRVSGSELKIYPNPASTVLTVQLNFPEHTAPGTGIELVMHDLQGRIVYRQNHPELVNSEVRIQVNHLPAGLYTLHCTVDGVWIDATKIVVE